MTSLRSSRLTLALAMVALTLASLAGYYLVHKPLTPAQALAYASTAANVAVAALVTVLGGGVGRRLLGRAMARADAGGPGERALLAAALGWGVMALAVLALGLVRLLYAGLVWALALVVLAAVRREMGEWWRDVMAAVRGLAPTSWLERLAAAYVGLVLALGLLQAAGPPLKWDALVYHLTLPRRYAETHGLYLPLADFSLFTGMPQLGEMLYTTAHLLRADAQAGSIAAQVVGWVLGALLALGLASAGRAHGLAAWLAPAVVFSSYSVAASLTWAYVDLLLMLLALAMLLALEAWRRGRSAVWVAAAGAYGGLAFGCKYTGIIVPAGGLAVLAWTLWRCPRPGETPRQRLRTAALFGAVAALVAAPWLVKNWALTGSPVYPLVFPAADMDAARQWFYNRPDLAERNLLGGMLIFWRAAFLGVQGANNYDVTLGPLLILLPAALALGWRGLPADQRAALAPWVVFVAVAYAAWVALVFVSTLAEQTRLFFAVLPALALLGAAGWAAIQRLDTRALRASLVVASGLALALVLSANEVATQFIRQQPLAYLAGEQTALAYSVEQLGGYSLALEQVNALPAGARVVFLWEARSLDCRAAVRCVPDVVIDRWWHLRRALGLEPGDVLAHWQREGVTHVLIGNTGQRFVRADPNAPFTAADWAALEALRARLEVVDTVGDAYTLYALR